MKKKTSKLTFQRETLKVLSDRVLEQVAGGEDETKQLGAGCTSSFVLAGGDRK